MFRFLLTGSLFAALAGSAMASRPDISGAWFLKLQRGNAPDYGTLTIEGTGARAFIDGGSVAYERVDDTHVRLVMDWSDGGDQVHDDVLTGQVSGGQMAGDIMDGGEKVGTWRALPEAGRAGIMKPLKTTHEDISLAGVWSVSSRGTHKDVFDLTAGGQAIQDRYDATLDDPHLRCVAGGLIRILDGPFPIEVIEKPDRLTVIYQYFHQVRTIYMDGRAFPDDVANLNSTLGYSIGHWEDSTLVIETRGVKPALWDARGMPISADAVVTERMSVTADGNLHNEITLHDSANYTRPVLRHAYWHPTPDVELAEYDCDPHAFYRALDLEGRLKEYWSRSKYRR